MEFVDRFVSNTGIIPNYSVETTQAHGLRNVLALSHALRGPFTEMLAKKREQGAARVLSIHPSLASPYVVAGAIHLAYEADTGEDIRSSIYAVVGAYPAVMKYKMRTKEGNEVEVSPIGIGRSLGNLMLTAPKTANTETDEKTVQDWMRAARATFKLRNREILDTAGNVQIVNPAGRRGKRALGLPLRHTEYRPDSSLDYITDIPVPTFVVGVDDNLLNNPKHPESIVNVVGDPHPRTLKLNRHVIEALIHSAELSSIEPNEYVLEGKLDQKMRQGADVIRGNKSIEE